VRAWRDDAARFEDALAIRGATVWVMGCFRCELQAGPAPRVCLYHEDALLRAIACDGDETVEREADALRRFVEDPLVASVIAARG
jgi:hypothetical protein